MDVEPLLTDVNPSVALSALTYDVPPLTMTSLAYARTSNRGILGLISPGGVSLISQNTQCSCPASTWDLLLLSLADAFCERAILPLIDTWIVFSFHAL